MHQTCHIAFDQVGSHWIGGVAMYAMYLSVPVIANCRGDVFDRYWGETSPICDARDEDAIVEWLIRLEDPATRSSLGERSHRFALEHFGGTRTTQRILDTIGELKQMNPDLSIARFAAIPGASGSK
jgi:hypothetical protein